LQTCKEAGECKALHRTWWLKVKTVEKAHLKLSQNNKNHYNSMDIVPIEKWIAALESA